MRSTSCREARIQYRKNVKFSLPLSFKKHAFIIRIVMRRFVLIKNIIIIIQSYY